MVCLDCVKTAEACGNACLKEYSADLLVGFEYKKTLDACYCDFSADQENVMRKGPFVGDYSSIGQGGVKSSSGHDVLECYVFLE